jgi:hypothetical protein
VDKKRRRFRRRSVGWRGAIPPPADRLEPGQSQQPAPKRSQVAGLPGDSAAFEGDGAGVTVGARDGTGKGDVACAGWIALLMVALAWLKTGPFNVPAPLSGPRMRLVRPASNCHLLGAAGLR